MCDLRTNCLTEAEVDVLVTASKEIYKPGKKNRTYFMYTDSTPNNVIERYALQLLHAQTQCACVEWWVQIRDENDPLIFHFDNDDNGDYPKLTSVTYLSNSNTCTAITSIMYSSRWCTRDKVIESTTFIKPQRGNVACFDGKHLHSTLSHLKWPVPARLKVASPNNLSQRRYKSVGSDEHRVVLEIPTVNDHIILQPGGRMLVSKK